VVNMRHVNVAIVGGGIAGLAAAHRLYTQTSLTFVVIDAAERIGGNIGSARVAGVTLDTAADAFLARVEGAVDLAAELGMADDLIAPATGNAGVFIGGTYRLLPSGLVLGVPSDLDAVARSGVLTADGLARAAMDDTVAQPFDGGDRSIADAIGSHLGREVVERLVDPLLGGISAAHCDDLSIDAASAQLAMASRAPHLMVALREQQAVLQRGQIGVTEARPVFLTPKLGVHTIVSRLVEVLADSLSFGTAVDMIDRNLDGTWTVGEFIADTIILATAAPTSARLVEPYDASSAAALASVRMASVALVLLAYDKKHCAIPEGSGVLVPRTEKRFISAASWWNHKWPHLAEGDHQFIRASSGRIDDVTFQSMSDEEIVAAMHLELGEMTHINGPPVDVHVARWMNSFPQYDVGHLDMVNAVERDLKAAIPGVVLAGSSLRGVGMPACIRSGRTAAEAVMTYLSGTNEI
jgi:protoporphyrinogen/coproporphyrinogen III oxidase